jgi:hypothetical protein
LDEYLHIVSSKTLLPKVPKASGTSTQTLLLEETHRGFSLSLCMLAPYCTGGQRKWSIISCAFAAEIPLEGGLESRAFSQKQKREIIFFVCKIPSHSNP